MSSITLNPLGANKTELCLGDGTTVLLSYKTSVAAFVAGRGWIKTSQKYSKTTTKHINSWVNGAATVVDQSEIDALLSN